MSNSRFAPATLLAAGACLLATACGSAGDGMASTPPPAETAQLCDAGPAQSHVGSEVTEAIGAAILSDSGARTLRWGPPRSAWTMDYRQDRVNVRYDDDMKIIDVTCG